MNTASQPKFSLYTSGVFSVCFGVLQYLLSRIGVHFENMFSEAGAELPLLTQMLLPGSWYYWIIAFVFAFVHVSHQAGFLSRQLTSSISTLGTFFCIAVTIIGFYLPIFRLGDLVQ